MIREDVPYIRRRVKYVDMPASEQKKTSLKFNNTPLKTSNVPPFKAVEGKVILTLEEPVIRLNNYQSAIGSLVIKNATMFAWEGYDGYGNLIKPDDASDAPMYGNRPLAEFHKGDIVVGLRHSQHLRRLIVGKGTDYIRVNLYDGSEIIADAHNGDNVLILSRVGQKIEIRLENIHGADIIQTFSVRIMP